MHEVAYNRETRGGFWLFQPLFLADAAPWMRVLTLKASAVAGRVGDAGGVRSPREPRTAAAAVTSMTINRPARRVHLKNGRRHIGALESSVSRSPGSVR